MTPTFSPNAKPNLNAYLNRHHPEHHSDADPDPDLDPASGPDPDHRRSPCSYTNATTGKVQTLLDSTTGEPATCYAAQVVPRCGGNGDVFLPFGTAAYVGLGATVFFMLVIIELFGCALQMVETLVLSLFCGQLGRRRNIPFVRCACPSFLPQLNMQA